jgi:tetratricopeptide (TPR) repeat protein
LFRALGDFPILKTGELLTIGLLSAFIFQAILPDAMLAKSHRDPQVFITKGDQEMQANRFEDAIDQYAKAIKVDRRNPKTLQLKAQAEIQLKRAKPAVKDLGKAIKLNPNDPQSFLLRVEAYDMMPDYKLEYADLNALTALQPGNGSVLLKRAQIGTKLDKWREALDDCNRAIDTGLSRESLGDLYRLRAEAYRKLGRKKEAEQEIAKYDSLSLPK